MKISVLISCCVLATLAFAGVALARGVPVLAYNRVGNYYYYTVKTEEPTYNEKEASLDFRGPGKPKPYHKYVACVAWTFFFEECTLCYCTDAPNVAVCWDHANSECKQTQKLVDEQRNLPNNDPTGVW